MGLTGKLVGAIWGLFGRIPGVNSQIARQKRAVEVSIEAEKIACSSRDDSTAKATLAERIGGDSDSFDAARSILLRRNEYVSNRAYRLLSAIGGDTPVESAPQHMEQLFGEEEAIGRMPLDRAFLRLAEMEPRLRDLERQMREGIVDMKHSPGLTRPVNEALVGFVGVGAGRDGTLLGTNLAASIVRQYLEIRSGVTVLGSIDTSYFDAPLGIGIRA